MRVAIVSDNGQSDVDEYTEQAMGPAYIAKSAKAAGHEVRLYHQFPAPGELLDYDVVGFSANSRDVPKVLRTSREIKIAKKGLVTIVGGSHVSGEALDWQRGHVGRKNLPFLYSSDIDYSVVGEGDVTFPRLLEAVEGHGDIPKGVIYQDNGQVVFTGYAPRIENLDDISFPTDFRNSETFDMQALNYCKERVISIPVIESRGCPGQGGKTCSFCSSGASWGKVIRYRSGGNILKEVNEAVDKFGLDLKNVNVFLDSIELMGNREKFYDILDSFKNTPYTLGSCGDIRRADGETLERMAEAGYTDVLWGIESLDPEILDKYKAELTFEEIKETISLANSGGIKSTGMFMMGFPEETEKSVVEWFKGIGELGLESIRFSIVTPLPGTEFRSDLLKSGIGIEDYSGRWDTSHLVYSHPNIGKQEAEKIRANVISQFLQSR